MCGILGKLWVFFLLGGVSREVRVDLRVFDAETHQLCL